MSTTARNVPEPYTGPDTSAQLIALQQLEHIAVLQHEPAGGVPAPGARAAAGVAEAGTAAGAVPAPWSDAEAFVGAPDLLPGRAPARERIPVRHGRSDLERLLDGWRRVPLLGRLPFPLVATLVVQAVLSLRLIWSNTAFADEALYLWAGHLEWAHWLHGTSIAVEAMPTYFSGSPAVYPPLGALADTVGGLAGARLLSLLFMLGTTSLLFATTRRLFNFRSAVFAAALFAGADATQFLGAFATYDAMALFLLALAMWAGVRATSCGSLGAVIGLEMSAGAAMALADAAKYAATLFDPVVAGVAALALWRSFGRRRAVAGTAALLGALVTLGAAGVWAGGRETWIGIMRTTLARSSGTESMPGVLFISGKWIGAIAFLAICGAFAAGWSRGWHTKLMGALLAFAVFMAPIEQARIHTLISLFKHVGYGALFGCVVAGYALAALAGAVPAVKAKAADRVSAVAVAIAGIIGIAFAGAHFAGWPNSTQMIAQISPVLARAQCPCLATQNNAINYYLHEMSYSGQLKNAFSFHFWDKHAHRELGGAAAADAAIEARYLNVVEVDPSQNAAVYAPITRTLAATSGYRLVGTSPSGISGEPTEIWVLGG